MDNQEASEVNRKSQRRCEEGNEDRDGDWNMHNAEERERNRDRDEDEESDRYRARDEERERSRDRDEDEERNRCCQCDEPLSNNGELLHHVRNQAECLFNYTRRVLPKKNSAVYSRNSELAMFHLAVRFNLCCNPGCPDNLLSRMGFVQHLTASTDCLEFYRREGRRLFQWVVPVGGLSPAGVGEKIRNFRKHLKRDVEKEEELGAKSFIQEQVNILNRICVSCLLQGPLTGKKAYDLEQLGVTAEGHPTFICMICKQKPQNIEELMQRLRWLGEAQGGEEAHIDKVRQIDDTMTPITIPSNEAEGRVVFVPSVLAVGQTRAPDEQVTISATVLVPLHEDAIEEIGHGAFDRAYQNKGDLKFIKELFSKQGIPLDITTGLSMAWRMVLLDVQTSRWEAWHAMGRGKGEGEVLERNPRKKAKIIEEKKLWSLTKKDCLKKSLPWCLTSISHREAQSQSASCINGQVKTYVKFSVLDSFSNTGGELPAIIARAARQCVKVRQLETESDTLPKFRFEVLCESFCDFENCQETKNHKSCEQFMRECEQSNSDWSTCGQLPLGQAQTSGETPHWSVLQ